VISETVIDGALAAFHGPPPSVQPVAEVLTRRFPDTGAGEIERLLGLDWPGILFRSSPFVQAGSYIQISPCDERCMAGEVSITVDSRGPQVEISGEVFTVRPVLKEMRSIWR
jgi:hypothetical protein